MSAILLALAMLWADDRDHRVRGFDFTDAAGTGMMLFDETPRTDDRSRALIVWFEGGEPTGIAHSRRIVVLPGPCECRHTRWVYP